jgi:REP element-mobilizing transposase RayT
VATAGSSGFRHRIRRSHRLPIEAYDDAALVWLITIGAADRQSRPFQRESLADALIETLIPKRLGNDSVVHLYCLMPDHIHLIWQVLNGNLLAVVSAWKSTTTRIWWRHGGMGRLWQPSFYDQGIRGDQAWNEVVRYILENPQRAGLVEHWENYPYIGGTILT